MCDLQEEGGEFLHPLLYQYSVCVHCKGVHLYGSELSRDCPNCKFVPSEFILCDTQFPILFGVPFVSLNMDHMWCFHPLYKVFD